MTTERGILPNCGQRVADDHAWVPKSVCWFLGCVRSTSAKPEGTCSWVLLFLVYKTFLDTTFREGGAYFGIQKAFFEIQRLTEAFGGYKELFFWDTKNFLGIQRLFSG